MLWKNIRYKIKQENINYELGQVDNEVGKGRTLATAGLPCVLLPWQHYYIGGCFGKRSLNAAMLLKAFPEVAHSC